MDENLSRGYIQLGKARGANDFRFTNGFSHLSPPVDKYNGIYLSLVLAGVGFLLPYNSFIIAVDYFQKEYPRTTIVFDMSLVYIIMAFFAVLANNLLVEALTLNTRITFGYIVSFFTLLFVATCQIWLKIFSTNTSYFVNLIAVAVVALGCTVQQSSFYGYTSMLPSRYTQAVMAGESAAGLFVSINRIITKMLLNNLQANTLIFFTISVIVIGLCFGLHQIIRQTDFVQFYLTLCKESKKITLEPTEDAGLSELQNWNHEGMRESCSEGASAWSGLGCSPSEKNKGIKRKSNTTMDPMDQLEGKGSQYGVLKLQPQSPLETHGDSGHFSFANPVYEPTASGNTTYKVEDVVVQMRGNSTTYRRPSSTKAWSSIHKGITARIEVARNIWHYMLSIGAVYFVTLSLYPGIESEIVSCKFGTWMPVMLMAAFNASDLLGKMMAPVFYECSRTNLVMFACVRSILVPLMILCAVPRHNPIMEGESSPLLFSILLGLSNGIIGSVPMIQAPSRVSEQHRELAGNIMTLSYNLGLTAGSLVAYVFEKILGAPVVDPCGVPEMYHNSSWAEHAVASTTYATSAASASTTSIPQTTIGGYLLNLTASNLSTLISTNIPFYSTTDLPLEPTG